MRKLRKSEKKMILRILLVFIVIVSIISLIMIYNRTQILERENYSVTSKENAYIFKREAYVSLDTDKTVNFTVKNGTKASSSSVLSKDIKISTAEYAKQMLSAINYILENDKFKSVEEFLVLINEKQKDINTLQGRIDSSNDEAEKASLTKTLNQLSGEYETLQIAVRFVFSDTDYLKSLKTTYTKLAKSTNEASLTLGNLNFPYTGYVYYELDGYENVLNASLISSVDSKYIDYIDSFHARSKKSALGKLYVKVVNSSYMYVVFSTDVDTYLNAEEDMSNTKAEILQDYEYDNMADFYALLQRRNDILFTFPTVQFTDANSCVYRGYYINSVKDEKSKIVVLMLKSNVNNLMDKNIVNINLVTEGYEAFIVPKSAIRYKGEGSLKKAYVLSREKQGLYKYVPVNVYKIVSGKAILRIEDNPDIESLEIFLRPGLRFWKKVE